MIKRLYLTPAEVSERYGHTVSERTLANWRSRGDGPPYTKIGGKVLYPVEQLAAWEEQRTIGARWVRRTVAVAAGLVPLSVTPYLDLLATVMLVTA